MISGCIFDLFVLYNCSMISLRYWTVGWLVDVIVYCTRNCIMMSLGHWEILNFDYYIWEILFTVEEKEESPNWWKNKDRGMLIMNLIVQHFIYPHRKDRGVHNLLERPYSKAEGSKPSVIARYETWSLFKYGVKGGRFWSASHLKTSILLCSRAIKKSEKNSCVKNVRRASNPAYFPTSAHRAKRCMTCVCLLVFKNVQKLLDTASPNSKTRRAIKPSCKHFGGRILTPLHLFCLKTFLIILLLYIFLPNRSREW